MSYRERESKRDSETVNVNVCIRFSNTRLAQQISLFLLNIKPYSKTIPQTRFDLFEAVRAVHGVQFVDVKLIQLANTNQRNPAKTLFFISIIKAKHDKGSAKMPSQKHIHSH